MDYRVRLWLICGCLALFGTIPLALDRTFPNNAQNAMQNYLRSELFGNSTGSDSTLYFAWSMFITGSNIGGIFVSFAIPWFTDRMGRPKALALVVFVLLISHGLQALSKVHGAWILLFIGRLVYSCGAQPYMVVLPVYLSEVAPPKFRGRLGSVAPTSILIGNMAAYTLGLPSILGNVDLWFYGYVICFLLTLPLLPLCLSLKETPVYLLAEGKEEATQSSLQYYRGKHGADDWDNVEKDAHSKKKGTKAGLGAFYQLLKLKPLRAPMGISLVIVFAYCAEGLFSTYSTATFQAGGVSYETSTYLTVALQAACIISFFICFIIVDRYGRRPLVIVGLVGAATCWILMTILQAVVFYKGESDSMWPTITFCVLVFGAQLFLNLGIRPIFWILVPEILPFKYRSTGKSLTFVIAGVYSMVLYIAYYNVLQVYPIAAHAYIALSLILCTIYAWIKLPETKDKAPHEIFPKLLELADVQPEEEIEEIGPLMEMAPDEKAPLVGLRKQSIIEAAAL